MRKEMELLGMEMCSSEPPRLALTPHMTVEAVKLEAGTTPERGCDEKL
jgi:hypothetical protein